MPRPKIKISEARVWLEKAAHDIDGAEVDQRAAVEKSSDFLWDVMFHCQQAVEKSLKGFLTWHDVKLKRTHDLAEIGAQCAALDPELSPVVREAEPLSQYAWEFRYPGESDDPTDSQAREALALAKQVYNEVLSRLPEAAHPMRTKGGKDRKKVRSKKK